MRRGNRYMPSNWLGVLFVVALYAALIGGWVANIVKLTGMTWTDHEVMVIVRVIGVFTGPVGSVLGFI